VTQYPPQARRYRPHPVRQRNRWGALRVGLLVLLAAILVVAGLLIVRLAAFNGRVSTAPGLTSAMLGGLAFGEDRINVLIIGYGGEEHAGAFLSDSMNVASIDPATDTTTLIPVPRDLWIEGDPVIPENGKVNQAFALGVADGGVDTGGERAAEVVSRVTGLDVSLWIALDFDGFATMVDSVGGVTVNNPTAFRYGGPDAATTGQWDDAFSAGEITLTGEQALYYARTRYTDVTAESSDFARSVRQQQILNALVEKVAAGLPWSTPVALDATDAAAPHLRTNMSVIDLGLFALNARPDRRVELAEDQILEATTTTDGQYALVVIGRASPRDYEPLQEFIRVQLADPPSAARPTDIAD